MAWDVDGQGRLGGARWVRRVRQLADAGERAGRIPRQSAGADPADLLRPGRRARRCSCREPAIRLLSGSRSRAWRGRLCVRWHHVSTRRAGSRAPPSPIGGINPDLKTPTAYIYTAAVEHRIGHNLAASVLYSGSHSDNLVGNGNQAGVVSYGVDINALPWGHAGPAGESPPTRLNPSFGSIILRGQRSRRQLQRRSRSISGAAAKRIFFDASYTRSSSKDDAGYYPTSIRSAPVLWAVSVGRPPPLLAYGELRGARVRTTARDSWAG